MSPRSDPKMRAIQDDLAAGRESALLLRRCLLEADHCTDDGRVRGNHHQVLIPQLLERIILSFHNSITALDCGDQTDNDVSAKVENSGESRKPSRLLSVRKGRRGCYKRRQGSESWTKVVPALNDDGHTWRKYGQKVILNSPFPRSYFRCTHKNARGCLATKQVQQTQSDPLMYSVSYEGHHTCANSLKSPSLFGDDDRSGPAPNSSTVLLSFNSAESNLYRQGCYPLSSDSTELPVFASNASSSCSNWEQEMEFMQYQVGPVDFDDFMKLEFEF